MPPSIRMVSVPPNVLESIAFNLCSLHDFDPAYVQQNERFALATITEYLRAQPAAAPVREEGGAVLSVDDVPVWADGIVTDGERVAMAQKAEADHGGTYWAVDGGDGGLDWEPTHFISLTTLATREEAPAEAGEDGAFWFDPRDPEVTDTNPDQILIGHYTAFDVTMIQCGDMAMFGFWFEPADGSEFQYRYFSDRDQADAEALAQEAALRTQPQARGEAQLAGLDVLEGWEDPKTPSVPGPVAWRCRNIGGTWFYREARQQNVAVCEPLYDRPAPTPPAPEAEKLLNALRDNSWDLRCFDVPTGGDDCDIGWRVIGHWQAEPRERTIAEVFTDDPAEAVRQALAALQARDPA